MFAFVQVESFVGLDAWTSSCPKQYTIESFYCCSFAWLGFSTCRVCLFFVGLVPQSVVGSLAIRLGGSFKR